MKASSKDVDAYLHRIGYAGPTKPELATLKALHLLHPLAIPFENLDPLLGRPVPLDLQSLQAKLVTRRRGGYCFEHNLLFMAVLASFGFPVSGLAARVMWNYPEGSLRPRTHILLRVELDGETWIADVGFGILTMTAPLRLREGIEQSTPHETFRLERDGTYWVVLARLGDGWRALYRFDLDEHQIGDYEIMNHYLSAHPQSVFVNRLMAARATHQGRLALNNRRFSRYGAEPFQKELATWEEVEAILRDEFEVDVPPGFAKAMARKGA